MSHFDEYFSGDFKSKIKYKPKNSENEDSQVNFEENQVQFIPVQLQNESKHNKHSRIHTGLHREHCYSTAELKAIEKFNSLFKKIIVLPSNSNLLNINYHAYNNDHNEKLGCLHSTSSFGETFDVGHNSKEIQMAEENEVCALRTNDLSLQQNIISKHSSKLSNEKLNRNSEYALNCELKKLKKFLYSYAERFYQADFEYRNSELLYPILFPSSETKELKDILRINKKHKGKTNENYKKNSHGTEDTEKCFFKKIDTDTLQPLETNGTESFQQISLREITDVFQPINQKFLDMLFSINDKRILRKCSKSSALNHLCREEIDAKSSKSLLLFRCCGENPEDVKKAIDRILQKLKNATECPKICGCPSKNSCKVSCIPTTEDVILYDENKTPKCTEVKQNDSIKSSQERLGREVSKNYEDKMRREERIRELLEKIMSIIRSSCIKSSEHVKAIENRIHEQNLEGKSEIVSIPSNNLNEKKTQEVIPDTQFTVDGEKRKERADKLRELVRMIMMKRKCVCRDNIDNIEILKNNVTEKIISDTDLVEESSMRSRESSDISIEALNREFSTSSSDKRSSKKVSFLEETFETNTNNKYKNIKTEETEIPKFNAAASIISMKSRSSSQSLEVEDAVEKRITEEDSIVSEEIYSTEKVDSSTNTEDEGEGNDTFQIRKTEKEVDEEISSEEEFYDTTDKRSRSTSEVSEKYDESPEEKNFFGKGESLNSKDRVSNKSDQEIINIEQGTGEERDTGNAEKIRISKVKDSETSNEAEDGQQKDTPKISIKTINNKRKNSQKLIEHVSDTSIKIPEQNKEKHEKDSERGFSEKRPMIRNYFHKIRRTSRSDLDFNKINSKPTEKPLTAPLIGPVRENRGFKMNEITKTKKELVNKNDISIDIQINVNEPNRQNENKTVQTKKIEINNNSLKQSSRKFSINLKERKKEIHPEVHIKGISEVDIVNQEKGVRGKREALTPPEYKGREKLGKLGRYERKLDNIEIKPKQKPIPLRELTTVSTMKGTDHKMKTNIGVEKKNKEKELNLNLKAVLKKREGNKIEMNEKENMGKNEKRKSDSKENEISNLPVSRNKQDKNKRTSKTSYHHKQVSTKSIDTNMNLNKLDSNITDMEQNKGYKIKHKTLKNYFTASRESSVGKTKMKKRTDDNESISSFGKRRIKKQIDKNEKETDKFDKKNQQFINKQYSNHEKMSLIKSTDTPKEKILLDTKFTDTTLDESLPFGKKTSIRDEYINPFGAKTRYSFTPNFGSNDIKRRMEIVGKNISCDEVDSLFGLGYLLEGQITECKDENIGKEEQKNKSHKISPFHGETMTKSEIRENPKIEIMNKEKTKYASITANQAISQEELIKNGLHENVDEKERKTECECEKFTRPIISQKQEIIENKKIISIEKDFYQNGIHAELEERSEEKLINDNETSPIYLKKSNTKHEERGERKLRHSSIFLKEVDSTKSRHHKKRKYSISLNHQSKNSEMDNTHKWKQKQTTDKGYREHSEKIIQNPKEDRELEGNKLKHTKRGNSNIKLKARKIVDSFLEDSVRAIGRGRKKVYSLRNSTKNIIVQNEDNKIEEHITAKPVELNEHDKNRVNYVQKEKIEVKDSRLNRTTDSRMMDQNSELKIPKLVKHDIDEESPDLIMEKLENNKESELKEPKSMKCSNDKIFPTKNFKPTDYETSSIKNRSKIEEHNDSKKDTKAKMVTTTKRTQHKARQKTEIQQFALEFVDDILKEGIKKVREKGNSRIRSKTSKLGSYKEELDKSRRKKVQPVKSPDRKLSWADDEIDVAKFAKYADILEDVSLDKAEEMEDLLRSPSPTMKKKSIDTKERKCSNECSKYKGIDFEEAWSSSDLRTQCCEKTNGLSASVCHGPLNVFKRRGNFGERRLFVPSSKLDVRDPKVDETSIHISVESEKQLREISRGCCGNIGLKRVRGIQSIRCCTRNISSSSLTSHKKSCESAGNFSVSIDSIKEAQRIQSKMKVFTRRRLGECTKVPSSSSGSFRDQKIRHNTTHDESLSNVLGPIVTSTESDVSNKFFSACDIPLDQPLCGCATAKNITEVQRRESWSKIRCSKATKCLAGSTETRNQERITNSSSSKNSRRSLSNSISDKIDPRRILKEESSSDSEVDVGFTLEKSNRRVSMEGRRSSEKSVRFEKCINFGQNRTNSLNLKRERSCEVNTRCIDDICCKTFCKRRMSVSLPQFSCFVVSEMKTDEPNETKPFSNECNEYFSTFHLENQLDESLSKDNCPNFSSSLMPLEDEGVNIENFNTKLIKAVKDKVKHQQQISETVFDKNESLQSTIRCFHEEGRKNFGKIISYISFSTTETINDFLFHSSISLDLSKGFNFDRKCFSALLDILTTSEQQILNVTESENLKEKFLQGYTFNNKKIPYLQNDATFSKSEKDKLENSHHSSESSNNNSSDFKRNLNTKVNKPFKIKGKSRRKLFDRYERQRSILLRKERKSKNVCLPVINISRTDMKTSESETDLSLHKSSSFYSEGALGSSSEIEKTKPGDIRRISSVKMKSDLADSSVFHAETFIVSDKTVVCSPNDNRKKNTEFFDERSRPRCPPNPYRNDQFIYHASVEVTKEDHIKDRIPSKLTKEPKQKLNYKDATKKMFKWFKTLGVSKKTEEVAKKKVLDPLWKTEENLLKQRKVLRSKLRYPKANTSTLYLHKREYGHQEEQEKIKYPMYGRIEPVLREISSSEIIEPELEDEDLEIASGEEDLEGEKKMDKKRDGRLLVFSEDSMVLFERKKVYDRLQRYGKLYYTIYLNEDKDMDHVSIRSAESVEHRLECEDKPFFATYNLGSNDLRVHVTKDTFEGKKREVVYKDENFVACQNSQVKLSLMRGKRYLNDLDPTKAKIIEIDCTNQFSEIKICYKKTEKSEECICQHPDTCKAIQLESSELSSLDMNKEDKAQDTHVLCENCEECQEKPETCDNYEECTKGNVCSIKKKSTLGSTVVVNPVPQEFALPRKDSEGENEEYETESDENALSKHSSRSAASKRSRSRQNRRYSGSRRYNNAYRKKR